MRVFTLAHCTSYMALTASLIFCLVAVMSTMKTRVLISSIFFIADSVVKGLLMMANLSILSSLFTDFRGYFGSRFLISVLGRKKWMLRRFLDCFRATDCFTAFETLEAFLLPSAFLVSALLAFGA